MANAEGRLIGWLLSGLLYEFVGLVGCLWGTFALTAPIIALALPRRVLHPARLVAAGGIKIADGD